MPLFESWIVLYFNGIDEEEISPLSGGERTLRRVGRFGGRIGGGLSRPDLILASLAEPSRFFEQSGSSDREQSSKKDEQNIGQPEFEKTPQPLAKGLWKTAILLASLGLGAFGLWLEQRSPFLSLSQIGRILVPPLHGWGWL